MNYIEVFWDSGSAKYSKLGLTFTDHQSEPILANKPQLTRSLLFDYNIENSTLSFDLVDCDLLTVTTENENILGTKVKYYSDDGNCLFTGYINEFPKRKEDKRVVSFKADIFSMLNTQPNFVITADEFPDAPEKNIGKFGNIIIGNETPGQYVAYRVGTNKYLAAWHALTPVSEAKNKDDEIVSVNFAIDPPTGYSYLFYVSTDEEIYFSADGPEDQGSLIENPASMLNYLIGNFSGFQFENLSEAISIYEERDYDGNFLYVDDGATWLDIFKNFALSYNCRIVYTKDGNLKFKLIKWVGETPLFSINDDQIKNLRKWKETRYLCKAWFRKYQIDPNSKEYMRTPQDLEAEVAYNQQIGEIEQKFLIDDMVSMDVGTRDAYLMGKSISNYAFEIPEFLFYQLELGDSIEICHRKSFFPCEKRMIQILRIQSVDNSGFYSVEGYDIHEIQGTPFIVREDGDPSNPIIYATDDSRNPKVWWSN